MRRGYVSILAFLTLTPMLALPAALRGLPVESLDPPAAPGAMAPQLTAGRDRVWLSWIEPQGPTGHALRVASWRPAGWSPAVTVAAAGDMLANWADVPAVAEAADGVLLAHWLQKTKGGYLVQVVRSTDGGLSWTPLGPLATDTGPSEHGFVSYAPVAGVLHAFWMDGRNAGAMALFDAAPGGTAHSETVLDERVCDCCATAAASTDEGPVIVYRDRSASEVRDIGIVRFAAGAWRKPALVHADGWQIHGCPVNGPAVAASGRNVVVAWYTAAGDRPRVQMARSSDAGATFALPVVLDDAVPSGRVGVALAADGAAWVSWIGRSGDGGELRLRRIDAAGLPGPVMPLAKVAPGRTAGVPRLVAVGDRLLVVWVGGAAGADPTQLTHLRVQAVQTAVSAPATTGR